MINPIEPDPLEAAMLADRAELRRLRRSIALAKKSGKPHDRNERRLERLLEESTAARQARLDNLPRIDLEGIDLPVLDKREEITAAIRDSSVTVVCGETGSGKSTQLPKLCLAAGRGIDGVIGHTQPRRLAARSVATRIAEELGSPLGEAVGYKVRFQDQTAPGTYVKLMTDGVLLAEAQGDPLLSRYDTLIVDEAHERSLNIDFLLGLLRRLIDQRPELRVIITSATIDAERFAEFFADRERPAPIIEVSGRTYPVEVRYEPPEKGPPERGPSEKEAPRGVDVLRAAADAVERLYRERVGDTLVFLPTERDIREAARLVRGSLGESVDVVPLYARLSSAEQQRVFKPGKKTRVVLATNVAESSLTVPGIMAVVDTGTARIARYSPRTRVQRLPIEAVSRASADQRAGRCGRIAPGVCVRLYEESDYESRPRYATPEIRRTNLAGVILRLLALKLGELEDFPLIDRPRPDAVREGRATLRELQAIDAQGRLTPLGEKLGRMPVDPRVGRMILAGADEGCLAEVLIIAAALEIQDPRERPADKQQQADEAHRPFQDGRSDFVGFLKLWDHLQRQRSDLSRSQFRKACSRQFLSYNRVLEWHDVYRQLSDLARQNGLRPQPRQDAYGAIHRALLTGLLSAVAVRRGEEGYQTPGGTGFQLWPGAGPAASGPRWVVAAETVETSRRYLRTVARIRPEWLPRLAEHLIEKEYLHARFSTDQQTVVASEKSTLFGLPIGSKKAVHYGPIAPAAAREVFIREGLVEEQLAGDWPFLEHNREAIQGLRRDRAKLRVSQLAGEDTLAAFYDERLPADVYDARQLRRWLRRVEGDPLRIEPAADDADAPSLDAAAFPDHLEVAGQSLPLEYEHSRGSQSDGVTLRVPKDLLPLVDEAALEWGVPGQLAERIVALIRALPKPLRTRLVPAPDAAARVAERLPFGEGRFVLVLAAALSAEAGADIAVGDLQPTALPDHLRMRVVVEDQAGEVIAVGRDLAALRRETLGGEAPAESQPAAADRAGRLVDDPEWTRDGLTDWSFGPLPDSVETASGRFAITAYPGLVDQRDAVGLRLFADRGEARAETARGVRRLFVLAAARDLRTQVKWLPDWDQLKKRLKPHTPGRDWAAEIEELLADRAIALAGVEPRDPSGFEAFRKQARAALGAATQEATPLVVRVLEGLAEGYRLAAEADRKHHSPAADDVRRQLADLTPGGFFAATPWDRLAHYPRYLKAAAARLARVLEGGGGQDRRMAELIEPHQLSLEAARDGAVVVASADEVERYRWMIEEYRVSVFAQKLGTAEKVSPKRLDEQWRRCRGLVGGK
ncbi:ATP-dependent RNA helicase HrpA [Botrimarina sp.]|uniref:ATP-dependent RNA helicase HrpA n=1 Tax=Botrimarina sp. TaxID=2795802 RepID=UPI0032EDC56F